MTDLFADILTLLAVSVIAVVLFQRLRMPSSLGYLLVGVLLGPSALGLVGGADEKRVLAEFGIVFLLFTIGLSFSLPQILAMRNPLFGLGTAQVAVTTLVVGAVAWLLGLSPAAALVVGAAFAQSSTTVISRQLDEQGEGDSPHGRLSVAMSVFQDVTAVPLVVIIPALGAAGAASIAQTLGLALLKAGLALVLVLVVGRWLMRALFNEVATRRSAELFTLAVLLVTLGAAAVTQALGLSLSLGAFLAGMVLGDTEFRHQVESTIRPFRDVLLGLFFVTVGMLVDLATLPATWPFVLSAVVGVLLLKALLAAGIVRAARIDARAALRIGVILAVGGEFGFAVLAIGLDAAVIAPARAQVVLTSILFSMMAGPLVIRASGPIAERLLRSAPAAPEGVPTIGPEASSLRDHVLVAGYGRIGQGVARLLQEEGVPYVALDLEPSRVRDAHAAGLLVFYGDAAERDILEAVGAGAARLVVISHDDVASGRKTLHHLRAISRTVPVMVRSRDETHVDEFLRLGATEVVPETLEAALMIASHALLLAGVAPGRVIARMREAQSNRYQLLRPYVGGEGEETGGPLAPE